MPLAPTSPGSPDGRSSARRGGADTRHRYRRDRSPAHSESAMPKVCQRFPARAPRQQHDAGVRRVRTHLQHLSMRRRILSGCHVVFGQMRPKVSRRRSRSFSLGRRSHAARTRSWNPLDRGPVRSVSLGYGLTVLFAGNRSASGLAGARPRNRRVPVLCPPPAARRPGGPSSIARVPATDDDKAAQARA